MPQQLANKHKCGRLLTIIFFLLGAYPRQDVAAQMSLRNCFRSSATLLAAVIVPNASVMSFSHLCLGFPRLLFPATIPCIIVFSKPLCRVTWPKYLSYILYANKYPLTRNDGHMTQTTSDLISPERGQLQSFVGLKRFGNEPLRFANFAV